MLTQFLKKLGIKYLRGNNMCLNVDYVLTENKLKSRQQAFYKAVDVYKKSEGYSKNYFKTPFQGYIIDGPGIQTIPKNERLDHFWYKITKGAFHLFTKKEKTDYWTIIPVTVKKKDIIKYGDFNYEESVAVHAYTISEKTWNKIFKEK